MDLGLGRSCSIVTSTAACFESPSFFFCFFARRGCCFVLEPTFGIHIQKCLAKRVYEVIFVYQGGEVGLIVEQTFGGRYLREIIVSIPCSTPFPHASRGCLLFGSSLSARSALTVAALVILIVDQRRPFLPIQDRNATKSSPFASTSALQSLLASLCRLLVARPPPSSSTT